MKRTINVRTYTGNIDTILNLGIPTMPSGNLLGYSGYGGIVAGGVAYYDASYIDGITKLDSDFKILTNDYLIKDLVPTANKAITLEFGGESIPTQRIPEFGCTIDNNIQIIQKDIPMAVADEIFAGMICYWDITEKLYCNVDVFTKDKVLEDCNRIAARGYYAPVTVYCDTLIQVHHFDHLYYLTKMIGFSTVPVRAVTYKDIRYVRNLNENFYKQLLTVPENKTFHLLDSVDMSPYFVTNYSDKRDILKNFKSSTTMPADDTTGKYPIRYRAKNFDDWFPILYFVFKGDYAILNADLASRILMSDVCTYVGKGPYEISAEHFRASSYLHGYDKFIDVPDDQIDQWHLTELLTHKNDYEVYKTDTVLDPSELPIISMSYIEDNASDNEAILAAFDADIIIGGDDKSIIIGAANLHNLLNRDSVRVKYIRHKNA